MCGNSAEQACQLAPSWSRDDHEDGGPTIQLPAAGTAAPLLLSTCNTEYIRRRAARTECCDLAPLANVATSEGEVMINVSATASR